VLDAVVVAAALVAGVTGAWSPCGFSMVDTLAPAGYAGRLATTLAACATFSIGAVAGGVATFGGLAALGHALGAGGTAATAVAAAVALAAAAGEARGARIVPQVRRQVPESWRRVLPVPLAAGLYGALLGLGFTTFILTFAVWALAGVSIALGDPQLGVLVGVAFGVGRLLPVVALAPVAGTDRGSAAHAAMAERPAILRGLRALDAAALALCALALATAPAQAATLVARDATDPSVDGAVLAWHAPGGAGFLRSGGALTPAPGPRPAVGGGRVAWLQDATVRVRGADLPSDLVLPAAGADAVAVGASWVAWRAREGEVDVLRTARLPGGEAGPVVAGLPGRELGRPALAGDTLLFHRTEPHGAVIVGADLLTGAQVTLRSKRRVQLLNPSALGGTLLYVRAGNRSQLLRIGALQAGAGARDRTIYSRLQTARGDAGYEPGRAQAPGHHHRAPRQPARGRADTLWTTALATDEAYVTRLRQRGGGAATAALLRVPRRPSG
jgi:hypothetical protein